MSNRIKQLERELQEERIKINNCSHVWNDTKYDPETVRELGEFSHYEGAGSDPRPVYIYVNKTKSRWSRECSKCGKIEYTYTQEAVVKEYKPKF